MNLRHQILALTLAPLIVAILVITAVVTFQSAELARASIATFERNMLRAKEAELLNLTNMAVSAIREVYENAGEHDEAAKTKVREVLSTLDYGVDGYFFVYDYEGTNLVHPRQAYRNGVNWLQLTDADGDRVIYNLIERAKAGGGLHRYKWEKPSTGVTADKLSFAFGLEKWRWMLGTGVYLDDVYAQTAAAEADLRASINRTFLTVAAIAVPLLCAVFLASFTVTLRERKFADSRLKELTHRIITAQEEERSRIARELHDGISQMIIAARYRLDLAASKVRSGTSDAMQVIERGASELNGAIHEIRRISHNLRPGILDDLGLGAALEALVDEFSNRTGIAAQIHIVAYKNLLHADARTAFYRVAQEALTNVERHARAKHVDISLRSNRHGIELEIADDGGGSAALQKGPPGLGLRNMQERMDQFGGHLLVRSNSRGTRITARLPRSVFITQTVPEPA